jgi:hypothetical protein
MPIQQTPWYVAAAETALGLVLTATPVALWIAWTPTMLFSVLAAAVLSALLLVLIHHFVAAEGAPGGRTAQLDEQFFVEMHRISPLVHHHSRRESARFRDAMRRVRRLLA